MKRRVKNWLRAQHSENKDHGIWSHPFKANREKEERVQIIFLGSKITADSDCSHKIKRHLLLGRKSMTNVDSILKKQRHYLADNVPSSQKMVFPGVMWELYYKESWVLKNWCFWSVVLEKTLKSPLDYREIQPVNPEGNQCWIFTGRTVAKAEAPILWTPDVENWLTGKKPRWERLKAGGEGRTEDEMIGWHHWLDGHEFEQISEAGDGQGSLVCSSSWGCKQLDTT